FEILIIVGKIGDVGGRGGDVSPPVFLDVNGGCSVRSGSGFRETGFQRLVHGGHFLQLKGKRDVLPRRGRERKFRPREVGGSAGVGRGTNRPPRLPQETE